MKRSIDQWTGKWINLILEQYIVGGTVHQRLKWSAVFSDTRIEYMTVTIVKEDQDSDGNVQIWIGSKSHDEGDLKT